MEKQQISITMPQIPTSKYKDNVKEIQQLVKQLNHFTGNLQQKVNNMLKGQETEFVNSYKLHMNKIQEALKQYQLRIQDYQKKIQHLENEGMLSILLKKISFLQGNEKKLLTNLERKDRIVNVLKGQISTQQKEILSLQTKIKQLILNHSPLETTTKNMDPTFPTEVQTIEKYNTLRTNRSIEYLTNTNPQYLTLTPHIQTNPEKSQELQSSQLQKTKKQLEVMRKKNRQLSSVNSKIIQKASSIQQFFVNTVNDLKRKIGARKKFNQCSLQDFKQQDKLQLLVKVLSNEEVLQHLYNKIFNKIPKFDLQGIRVDERSREKEELIGRSERVVGRLPAITSFRR